MPLPVPMANRVLERDPEIQQAQTRYDAPHPSIGRVDSKRGEVQKQRVLVPEHARPRSIAHGDADIHAQKNAEEQFAALQPAWDALRIMPGDGLWRRGRIRHRVGNGRRRRSRARSQGRRCHFRLMHSVYLLVPPLRDSPHGSVGCRTAPGLKDGYSNGNTGPGAGGRPASEPGSARSEDYRLISIMGSTDTRQLSFFSSLQVLPSS